MHNQLCYWYCNNVSANPFSYLRVKMNKCIFLFFKNQMIGNQKWKLGYCHTHCLSSYTYNAIYSQLNKKKWFYFIYRSNLYFLPCWAKKPPNMVKLVIISVYLVLWKKKGCYFSSGVNTWQRLSISQNLVVTTEETKNEFSSLNKS